MPVWRAKKSCSRRKDILQAAGYVIVNPSCIFCDTLLTVLFLRFP